jgi:prolyl oligopeptidase
MSLVGATPIPPVPDTPSDSVTDELYGMRIPDPYRWLEGDEKGKTTPEVARWTDAQNARTRAVLDSLPGRAELEARLRPLMEITSVSPPNMAGDLYFYRKREGTQRQHVLYVRDGHDGVDRVLLDPNALDPDGLLTLAWTAPSHDGSLLAYGTHRAGDEKTTLRLMDTATGETLPDEIRGKVSDVYWLPDSSGFIYKRLGDVNNPYSGQLRFHRLGTDPESDPVLFEQYKTGPLATTWGAFSRLSRDGRWVMLGYFTGTKSNDLYAVDFDRYCETGEFVPVEIIKGEPASFFAGAVGDTFYVHTTLDAPNGRIVAIDPRDPARAKWRTIVPERDDAVIDGFDLARGTLAVAYQHNASSEIRLFDLDGGRPRTLPLPGIGTASLDTLPDRSEAFLTFTSFNSPMTIYRLDLDSPDKLAVWQRPAVPVDPDIAEVRQVFYPSKDGTRVSMFLVHRKGLALDGRNPTMLTGYGGFGHGMTPYFSATLFPWIEDGGVLAMPNLRGGNEYGEHWHEQGMLARKQNTFDDFIAAGEWLVANKYTSPDKLGISGRSNGGLLTGAAVTQRPDLFAAAFVGVPLLDMVRYQHFLMARYWVPEYGTSEDPAQLPFLLKYSPYHNVNPGTKYPAVFLTAGENDTRVHPMHARKMAAVLQAANGGENPVLLWVDRSAGHGAGKPLDLQVRDAVDHQLFLRWRLGMGRE